MHHPSVKHTLSIFQRIADTLPPLVPREIKDEIREKLDAVYADHHISLEELEDIMIYMGKKIWPYIQAFEEFYGVYAHKMGERMFEQRASHGVKKKFSLFKQMGGTLADVLSGKVHEIFEHHEREELVGLLISLKKDIRKHALQAVMTHDFDRYTQTVEKYGAMIGEVNTVIDDLRRFASEVSHEDLARDMHDSARAIEHSLVFLGPKIEMNEIRGIVEYYEGKVREKSFR